MAQKLIVKEKGRWTRRLLLAAGIFALLLVALYFALTSTSFVQQYVLPPVSQLLGAEITVGSTSISPWSSVELKELRVRVGSHETLLEIEQLRVRYRLAAILRGRIQVDELTLVAPKLTLVETADGKNNLPALLNRPAAPPARKTAPPGRPDRTPRVEIQNVTVTGAQLRHRRVDKSGALDAITISDVELKLDRLQNGQSGKLILSSVERVEQKATAQGTNEFFTAKSSSVIDFTLTPDLVPATLKGGSRHEITGATGALGGLTGLTGRMDLDLTPTELDNFSLTFEQRGQRLGEVTAKGPIDLTRREGRLQVEVTSINRQVLNLLGARQGFDFQQSSLSASTLISLTKSGNAISGEGKVLARNLGVKQATGATPPVDLDFAYEFQANFADEKITLQRLQLSGRQGANEVLNGRLDYPMEISWGKTSASSFTKSTLTLGVKQFNLAEWRALHGRADLAGQLDATLGLTATPGNQRLQLSLTSALRDFASGTARQSQLQARLTATYTVVETRHLLNGEGELSNTNGTPADVLPRGLRASLDFGVGAGDGEVELRRAVVKFANGTAAGGNGELTGRYVAKSGKSDFALKLTGLNQHALGPFLAGALAPRQLASAALNGTATIKMEAGAQSTVEADLALANFITTGTGGARAAAPFGASVKLSAASGNDVHELKRLLVLLPPTGRAKNELEVTGRLDLRREKPEPSRLTVKAEELDVTALWDAFAPPAPPASMSSTQPSPAPPAPPSAPRSEPGPVTFPVKQLTAEVNVGRFYARQIAISNFVATTRIADSLLAVKPLEFTLNGAPVKALLDMNLGVRGWLYDLDLKLDRIPLQPIMDSVSPEKAGTMRGELLLGTELKGAGLTDTSIRDHLKGIFALTLTNASVELATGWKQGVLAAVATALRVPELAQAPIAWATGDLLVGGGQVDVAGARVGSEAFVAGFAGKIPLAPVLTNSPLDLPVTLELRRSLARKANVSVGGDTNAAFGPLPDFLRIKGTLGTPKADLNKLALGSVLLQSLSGATGGQTGAFLQGLSGLLSGQPPPAGTNQSATNAAPAGNPLDFLKKRKQ